MLDLHAWCLWRSEEGGGPCGTVVIGDYKLPCGCWDLFSPENLLLNGGGGGVGSETLS